MRILFVDDEINVLQFLGQIAEMAGFAEYTFAKNGEEALTYAIRNSYDLITLDILMPGVTGLEIVSLLRNLNPHAVIAVLSGHIPDSISDEISGCVDVMLRKPVRVEVIRALMTCASNINEGMRNVRQLAELQTSLTT